ncbi:MAG: OmpA/MotB domain protein [Phycisphaerales bacterium]|nr:OmpA/MotB domain protein [Phycisphaerales bacterium]
MAKPAKCPEGEECPEWIFTFADLVMLMMGFFVILWVLKPPAGKDGSAEMDPKWMEVVAKIREAFKYEPDPNSKDPIDMYMLMKKVELLEPPKGPGQGGETTAKPDGAVGSQPLVTNVRPGTHVSVGGRMGFAAGDATPSPDTLRVADEIVKRIRGHRNILQVKGHAAPDDLPDGATPQQLMDLSLRRAQAVADHFVAQGVSPDVVRVQGCSTFEPVVQRAYAAEAQAMNRRVEVEVSNTPVPDRQDQTRPAAAAPLSAVTGGAGKPAAEGSAHGGH